jgi:hypothetical protein
VSESSKAKIKAQQIAKYKRMLDALNRRALMGNITNDQKAMKIVLERKLRELAR